MCVNIYIHLFICSVGSPSVYVLLLLLMNKYVLVSGLAEKNKDGIPI